MKSNAIAVANYFVQKANDNPTEKYPLDLLRIVKYVYIAYGFALALYDRSIIDSRFDKVEAWRYGPVIPSVYHSFKYNKNNKITDMAVIVVSEDNAEDRFETPIVEDNDITDILDFVWRRYGKFTSGTLVDILHQKGTPWGLVYEEGKNVEIPPEYTKLYFSRLFENLTDGRWKSKM